MRLGPRGLGDRRRDSRQHSGVPRTVVLLTNHKRLVCCMCRGGSRPPPSHGHSRRELNVVSLLLLLFIRWGEIWRIKEGEKKGKLDLATAGKRVAQWWKDLRKDFRVSAEIRCMYCVTVVAFLQSIFAHNPLPK